MASTTRTRQSTAAARTRPPRPTAAAEDLDFEPIRIQADEDVPEERVPLFYIGDTEYTIPRDIPPGIALQYLRQVKESGHDVASGALLARVLGDDAYAALEESRGLTQEQLDRIVSRVRDLSLGREETKEGKARR